MPDRSGLSTPYRLLARPARLVPPEQADRYSRSSRGSDDHSQEGGLIGSARGTAGRRQFSERLTIILLSTVAFVVALNSIIIFPLGPFLADSLGFPPQQVGFLGSSYSIAAAIGGFISAGFLDRFDRRSALLACAIGL